MIEDPTPHPDEVNDFGRFDEFESFDEFPENPPEPEPEAEKPLEKYLGEQADIYYIDKDELSVLLEKELTRAAKEKRTTHDDMSAISGMLDEFLDSYIVIGFDMNENPVELQKMRTPLHKSGMSMLLQTFTTKYFRDSFK